MARKDNEKASRREAARREAARRAKLDPGALIEAGAWLRVTAKKEGFRRGGARFSTKPLECSAEAFTEEQLRMILLEPMLSVEVLPAPAKKEGGKEGGKEGEKDNKGGDPPKE